MDDFYLPRKIMRPIAFVVVLTALAWGIISGDMNNAGKFLMTATEPVRERIEKRINRILEKAINLPSESQKEVDSNM